MQPEKYKALEHCTVLTQKMIITRLETLVGFSDERSENHSSLQVMFTVRTKVERER